MKSFLTGLCLFIFLGSHTAYTFYVQNYKIEYINRETWKSCSYAFIILSVFLATLKENYNTLQTSFIRISFLAVLFTFAITILTNLIIIRNPYFYMKIVDIGSIIATVIILTSAMRYGYFKN